jgi:CBS domain-containing protein
VEVDDPSMDTLTESMSALSSPEGQPLGAPVPLDREVREVMTPGVVSIVEDASVKQARRAMQAHGVHAVLVVGCERGRPLGWITARGLLNWVDREESLAHARDAITEAPATIEPSASVQEAVRAILQPGVSHLLVQHHPDRLPEGVISERDLIALGRA